MELNSVICQSFPADKPLWSCLHQQNVRSQVGGVRFNQEPSKTLSLTLQSRGQRLNSEELHSSKLSRTEANGRSITGGFQIQLSSHLWACPSIPYSKFWLTRESKGVFPLRKMAGHHFQRMELMLLGNISTFKWQQVKTSNRVENTRDHLHRFTFYIVV